jgi:DNA-directed RNA polymerase specialized sigma24 family protein
LNPERDPSPSPERRESCPAIAAPANSAELESFYLEYFLPLVRRAIRRHRLSSEDAHDLVQEAFVLAIAKLDARRNPRAWLYQVVDHLAANHHRKVARRARLTAHWCTVSERARNLRDPLDEL